MQSASDVPDRPAPPVGVTVTIGEAADIDRLEPLWLLLHDVHQAADPELRPWVDDATSWSRRRELYSHCLASPDAFLLLVERGERLVGYVVVAVEPDGNRLWSDSWKVGDRVAELETIVLAPEERGHGLGTYLLDLVDVELARRGIVDLVIGAVPGNRAAIRLYERRGLVTNWVILSRFASRARLGADERTEGVPERGLTT